MATIQQRATTPDAGQVSESVGAPSGPTARERWQTVWTLLRGPYPTLVSRAVLGGVFLFSGIAKALAPAGFARDIAAYQMLPPALASIMAYGLPWLEILLGLYLLAGLYLRWSAVVTGGLLVVFMIAMGQAIARGLTLNCGCFGSALGGAALREQVNGWSIARDGVWLLMAAHLWFVPSIWTVDARLHGESGTGRRTAKVSRSGQRRVPADLTRRPGQSARAKGAQPRRG
jgi:uncharacterized membrane protein YphA (DoxX/SURF4 family)